MIHRKILKAFIPPVIVLAFHIILISLNLYIIAGWIDIPMHFLGGASVAWAFTSLIKLGKEKKLVGKNHNLINFIFVLSLVALISIFWEFAEYLVAIVNNSWQNTLRDTLGDFIFDLLGAPLGFLLNKIRYSPPI